MTTNRKKKKALPKNWVILDVDQLVNANWNYKDDDGQRTEMLMEALGNNLKRNGQIENILVRLLDTGFYEVVNGNHRLMAAKKIKGMDSLVCYNLGKISQRDAARIAVETNETKFPSDRIKLGKLISEISEEADSLDLSETMPFTDAELVDLQNLSAFDFDENELELKDEEVPEESATDKDGGGAAAISKPIVIDADPELKKRWQDWLFLVLEKESDADEARALQLLLDGQKKEW